MTVEERLTQDREGHGEQRGRALSRQPRAVLGNMRRRMARPVFAAGGVVVGAGLLAGTPAFKPDAAAGEKLFATCAACHAPESPTKTGPDLRGVFGRKAGAVSGFRYSRALKNAGIVWNDATLDAFLAEPQVAFPGNAMPFPGLPDPKQRLDLIAYLKTLR